LCGWVSATPKRYQAREYGFTEELHRHRGHEFRAIEGRSIGEERGLLVGYPRPL
jgi:hypothetical protein